MTSPPERIQIECPVCRRTYEDWYRASMNLGLDSFSEDDVREASTATCDRCGHVVSLESLIVEVNTWKALGGTTDMDDSKGFSEKLDAAFQFAHRAHQAQGRKQGPNSDVHIPYIGHLLGVAAIVIDEGGTEDEVIAGLLHDVAEDSGGSEDLERIDAEFGPRVRELVEGLSDTLDPENKGDWRPRKEAYLEHLAESDDPSLLRISLADKLYNVRSILIDHRRVGDEVFDRFTADKTDTLWYYGELAKIYTAKSEGPLATEFAEAVERLRAL